MFHKRYILSGLCGLTAIGLLASVGSAEILSDSANRKVLKVRSDLLLGDTTRKFSGNQLQELDALSEQIRGRASCGSIDIGNQSVSSSFSGEINVIVTGDIINTGNSCGQ